MSERARMVFWLIALALAAAAPLVIRSGRWLDFIELTLFVALLGQAWNILGGYGGQYSFGHAVFFGTGAYVQAMLQFRYGFSPWAAMPFAIGSGVAVGAFIGYLSFRYGLRGSYFALITLAFAEAFHVLARSLVSITEGGRGIQLDLVQDPAAARSHGRSAASLGRPTPRRWARMVVSCWQGAPCAWSLPIWAVRPTCELMSSTLLCRTPPTGKAARMPDRFG